LVKLPERPERGQRRRPVHDQAQDLLIGPAGRHRHGRGGGQRQVLGEGAAAHVDPDDVGAGRRAGHPLAHGDDLARRLEAGQVRRLRAARERAAGHGDVEEVDARGGDADQHLARAGRRHRRVGDQAEVLRAVQRRLLEGAHGGGDAHRNQLPFPGGLFEAR
jgi:hypothetical protein